MRFKNKLFLSLVSSTILAMNAYAGVVFQVETTYHSGSPGVETSEMSVEKPNLKMEIMSGENSAGQKEEVIFRGDRREMVVINHEEQYYMVVDPDKIQKMGAEVSGQIDQAMKELETHIEGLDPKQQAMINEMLKGQGGVGGVGLPGAMAPPKRIASEYRKTSQRASKQGYPCVKYEVFKGGEKVQELWVTDWDNVKGSDEVEAAFEGLEKFLEEMMESVGEMPGFGDGFIGTSDGSVNIFSKIDGFPVVTREFEGGELESETVLKSVSERDLDPDAFEPPKGYRLRTMGPQ